MTDGLFAVHDERMARVVSSLKTDHHVRLGGQVIHHLALSFVAPLGSDDHNICHAFSSQRQTLPKTNHIKSDPAGRAEIQSGAGRSLSRKTKEYNFL